LSISLDSGHRRSQRLALWLTAVVLSSPCAAGLGQVKLIPSQEVEKVFPAIVKMVMTQEPFPHDAEVKITLTGGGAVDVQMGDEVRMVVPVLVRFVGNSNSYCRLVEFNRATSTGEFIPIPEGADHDNCRGMRKMAVVDLNHDGVPDFAFQVVFPSNRYNVDVSEGAVYLSQLNIGKSYCYSPGASNVAASDAPFDPKKLSDLVNAAIARLGKEVLACYLPLSGSPSASPH